MESSGRSFFYHQISILSTQFGNVCFSTGNVAAIDWTDLQLRDFGEHGILNNAHTIRFTGEYLMEAA